MKTSASYEPALLQVSVRCFAELLRRCVDDDRLWHRISHGISVHGLLDLVLPRAVKPTVPEMDLSRLQVDARYRRYVAQQLRRPIAPDYWCATISIDRAQLSDEEYRHKMAGILGLRWTRKIVGCGLLNDPNNHANGVVVLVNMSPEFLQECLTTLKRHQSTGRGVSEYIIKKAVDDELQRRLEELIVVPPSILEDLDRRFERLKESTDARFDELIQSIRNRRLTQ